jgi:uncharacterized protein (DUF2062 family)
MKHSISKFRATVTALSPKQIALLFAVGLVLGVFPIPGFPTLLCLVAAFVLRLNAPALQLLNNLTGPLQLALWLPLQRTGAWLLGRAVSPVAESLAAAAWHAVLGWACVCIPAGVAAYAVTAHLLSRRHQ